MGCDSPLKGWRDRGTGGITFRREMSYGEKMEVGCGQCLGCRLDYSRMWAMRISHEAAMYEYNGGNCFITLTYRDDWQCTMDQWLNGMHVPKDWSLNKAHWQRFMKRLRKHYNGREIRCFYAGEYGRKCKHGIDVQHVGCPLCNTGRPHFHACLFGLTFDDLVAYESDGGITRYTSPTLEKIWGYGFVDVGTLEYGSACYVAGYVLKKVRGPQAQDWYTTVDLDGEVTYISPEFVGMSRGKTCKLHKGLPYQVDCPNCSRGIGRDWYETYKDDVFPSGEVPVPGLGVMHGVPRYYDEVLKEQNPEMYEQMKEKRKEYLHENADEYTTERLYKKHIVKKARAKLKERTL